MNTEQNQNHSTNSNEEANLNDQYVEDEADVVFDKKEKKAKRQKTLRLAILVIAGLVFCYSAYMLITIFLQYKHADDIYDNIQQNVLEDETVKANISDDEIEIPFKYDHNALLAINPEGVGYFYLPSANLRYPIVQSTDNDFYLTHTFDKTPSRNGCLFEDYRIKDGLDGSNVIIYGHNMNNGSMFGMLHKYKTASFYQEEGNDVFYIYTKNVIREYKIFSVYISEPVSDTYTFNFSNTSLLRDYAQERKQESMYDTGVDVSNADQVVTLSTCASNGETRLIVHGVFTGEATLDE